MKFVPEMIELNIAEQHGLISLIQKRDMANQQMREASKQLEECQKSIIQSRGKEFDSKQEWKLDVSTWQLVQIPKIEMPPVKGIENDI